MLRDSRIIAGIGNAYSDEILHAARLSPFKPANGLSPEEQERLYAAIRGELAEAIERSAAWRPKTSRATRSSTCASMGGPVRPARSAVPRSPRCRSR
ncbi:MAG: Fpg/Nei family DNA glycosylase, partial [Rubrivivax sp.]|nr:Fpg/Nei family DNA glycosylase [Rubrivivax sp.]